MNERPAPPDLERVTQDIQALIDRLGSLTLVTLDAEGDPEPSYAPYLFQDGAFHLFISQLAPHTGHLETQARASVMLMADETQTAQIFARERLILRCSVDWPEGETSARVLDAMQERHGSVLSLLRRLPDFRLVRLNPRDGRYVAGFGKAFRLEGLRPVEWLSR